MEGFVVGRVVVDIVCVDDEEGLVDGIAGRSRA